MPQEQTQALMIERARTGRELVRLKGGDPFVFGRGGEEALALREAASNMGSFPVSRRALPQRHTLASRSHTEAFQPGWRWSPAIPGRAAGRIPEAGVRTGLAGALRRSRERLCSTWASTPARADRRLADRRRASLLPAGCGGGTGTLPDQRA